MRTSDTHFTTAHLPGINWKKWIMRLLITSIIVSVLVFPYEIGHFIGSWVNNFIDGINLK